MINKTKIVMLRQEYNNNVDPTLLVQVSSDADLAGSFTFYVINGAWEGYKEGDKWFCKSPKGVEEISPYVIMCEDQARLVCYTYNEAFENFHNPAYVSTHYVHQQRINKTEDCDLDDEIPF